MVGGWFVVFISCINSVVVRCFCVKCLILCFYFSCWLLFMMLCSYAVVWVVWFMFSDGLLGMLGWLDFACWLFSIYFIVFVVVRGVSVGYF